MSLMAAEDRGPLPTTRGLCGNHLPDPGHSVRRMNTKLATASLSVRCLAQTPTRKHSVQRGVRTHIRRFAGPDAALQMAGPQLSKFPAQSLWRPVRDSNPRCRRERAVSIVGTTPPARGVRTSRYQDSP